MVVTIDVRRACTGEPRVSDGHEDVLALKRGELSSPEKVACRSQLTLPDHLTSGGERSKTLDEHAQPLAEACLLLRHQSTGHFRTPWLQGI